MLGCWLSLLLLLPLGALAQDGIHRCIGPGGTPLFTDQPCAALQATPVASPRDTANVPAAVPEAMPAPTPISCASTVADLRQGVMEAFASRDPNRLAALMLWNGYGRDAVVADIRSLGGLMQRPLLDVGEGDDPPPPATDDIYNLNREPGAAASTPTPPSNAGGDRQLVVRTAAGDGSGMAHESRFSVVRRAGCWWLRGSG